MISREQLLESLNWRYATKQFDPTRKISADDWTTLEQALVLTPSSFGLQPWKFVIVSNPDLREQLVAVSWGQRQVADASHFVVLAIKKNFGLAEIDALLDRTLEIRGGDRAALEGYKNMMVGHLLDPSKAQWLKEWQTRQVYIALGNLMTSAALLGIDTCPMEGLDPVKYDEILGLSDLGLATVVACPVGYRAAGDKYASLAKVRFETKDVITHLA